MACRPTGCTWPESRRTRASTATREPRIRFTESGIRSTVGRIRSAESASDALSRDTHCPGSGGGSHSSFRPSHRLFGRSAPALGGQEESPGQRPAAGRVAAWLNRAAASMTEESEKSVRIPAAKSVRNLSKFPGAGTIHRKVRREPTSGDLARSQRPHLLFARSIELARRLRT